MGMCVTDADAQCMLRGPDEHGGTCALGVAASARAHAHSACTYMCKRTCHRMTHTPRLRTLPRLHSRSHAALCTHTLNRCVHRRGMPSEQGQHQEFERGQHQDSEQQPLLDGDPHLSIHLKALGQAEIYTERPCVTIAPEAAPVASAPSTASAEEVQHKSATSPAAAMATSTAAAPSALKASSSPPIDWTAPIVARSLNITALNDSLSSVLSTLETALVAMQGAHRAAFSPHPCRAHANSPQSPRSPPRPSPPYRLSTQLPTAHPSNPSHNLQDSHASRQSPPTQQTQSAHHAPSSQHASLRRFTERGPLSPPHAHAAHPPSAADTRPNGVAQLARSGSTPHAIDHAMHASDHAMHASGLDAAAQQQIQSQTQTKMQMQPETHTEIHPEIQSEIQSEIELEIQSEMESDAHTRLRTVEVMGLFNRVFLAFGGASFDSRSTQPTISTAAFIKLIRAADLPSERCSLTQIDLILAK
eukprot:4754630-Pleurochrysis_carterae.AAC.1